MNKRAIGRILRKDQDWDYEYLIKLERIKLRNMLNYFTKSELTYNVYKIRDISLCLKLLDIVEEEDSISKEFYSSDLQTFPIYVNIRKYKKMYDSCSLKSYIIQSIRITKAWHLYNVIRDYKMFNWFD